MPKKKLVWYPGAMYHITSRGNHKNDIFLGQEDYLIYLNNLQEAIEYYENMYEIISFCLMTNHVHLQIKTKAKHIWYLISRVNKSYATNFNHKYNCVGHLFQSRYNGEIILDDRYMLEASRYIHLNPVRANIVKCPENYRWSSYNMYVGSEKEKLISSEIILSHFKSGNRNLYKKYVEAGLLSLSR